MAVLQELIGQIKDSALRDRLLSETNKLLKQKKFGLVFEEHLPECTLLFDIPIRVGATVALKNGYISDIYTVIEISGDEAICGNVDNHEKKIFRINELCVIAAFGEPIYPYLKKMDSVCNAPDSNLWHTLIEADNYHALQLLEYLYAGKVDCIYIDPPYNTGARDWKYNNDYVDASDSYRHSKWLSMMEKRLKIAKRLLNQQESVLIVTIDQKEYAHLACLLEEIFSDARTIQIVSSVINSSGSDRKDEFTRTNEFIFFIMYGDAQPAPLALDAAWSGNIKTDKSKVKLYWNQLMRSGSSPLRINHPLTFYPIFVSEDGLRIVKIGEPLAPGVDRNTVTAEPGTRVIWPIRSTGEEGRWQIGRERLIEAYEKGYVRLGKFTDKGMAITYLANGEQKKIEDGRFKIVGHRKDGSVIEEEDSYIHTFIPSTIWDIPSHNATYFGSQLINKIFVNTRFSYPKSLYAVHDTIRFFVENKPNALIVDFFAGSGTTLHAINLLNAEDGGNRRCIMVTNNEVSVDEAKSFKLKGLRPGDDEWEKYGIARYVTWPRTVCSIEGHDINGKPLKGAYIGSDIPMANGFRANAIFFKLGFLDKTLVALGTQFREMLPVLWMKAGAIGDCPFIEENNIPNMLILPKNRFAVLINDFVYADFEQHLEAYPEIQTVFIVTDSVSAYREMIRGLEDKDTYQLYRDYLDNFRINTGR